MKKIIMVGVGIAKINGREEVFKSWRIFEGMPKTKKEIHLSLNKMAENLLNPGDKIKELKKYIFAGSEGDYCSILTVRRMKKVYFGVGFHSHQIGSEVEADIEIMKKMNLDYVPRTESKIMLRHGEIVHESELDEMLRD